MPTDMHDDNRSDAELLAEYRRIWRRNIIAGLLAGLFSVLSVVVLFRLWRSGALQAMGMSHSQFQILVLLLPLPIVGVLLALLTVVWRTPKKLSNEAFMKRHTDAFQRKNRILYLLFPFIILLQSRSSFSPTGGAQPAIWSGLTALAAVTITCFGPGWLRGKYRRAWSDELVWSLRKRAAGFGYLFVMTVLAAVYVIVSDHPVLARALLGATLAAGAAVPMLYFLMLDWRADRD